MNVVCDGFFNIYSAIVPILRIADLARTAKPNRPILEELEKGLKLLVVVGSF